MAPAHLALPLLVSVLCLVHPLAADSVVFDPSVMAQEVTSYDSLAAAMKQANTNGQTCKGKPGCLGALVSVTLVQDIVLPGSLPPLAPNAHVSITGKCKRKLGRCIISGEYKYQVFPQGMGSASSNGPTGMLELNNLIFEKAKGGVLYNVYATVVAKDIDFRNNINGVSINLGYFGGAPPQTFIKCNFVDNNGTAILSGNGKLGLSPAPVGITVKRCLFKGNKGRVGPAEDVFTNSGGAVSIAGSGNAVFENTAFIDNVANSGGGAVFADQTNVSFRGVQFTGNKALTGGGGAVLGQSGVYQKLDAVFCTCTFAMNVAPKNSTVDSLLFRQYVFPSGGMRVDVAFCDTKVPTGSVFVQEPNGSVTVSKGKQCFKKFCKPLT